MENQNECNFINNLFWKVFLGPKTKCIFKSVAMFNFSGHVNNFNILNLQFFTKRGLHMINKSLVQKWTMVNRWCPNFETVLIKKSLIMGMLTMHLVVGVGILMPLFLLSFSYYNLDLPHVYMILGLIIFVSSIFTTIILLTKFINHGSAGHGFFAYSDTFSRLDTYISFFFHIF